MAERGPGPHPESKKEVDLQQIYVFRGSPDPKEATIVYWKSGATLGALQSDLLARRVKEEQRGPFLYQSVSLMSIEVYFGKSRWIKFGDEFRAYAKKARPYHPK